MSTAEVPFADGLLAVQAGQSVGKAHDVAHDLIYAAASIIRDAAQDRGLSAQHCKLISFAITSAQCLLWSTGSEAASRGSQDAAK